MRLGDPFSNFFESLLRGTAICGNADCVSDVTGLRTPIYNPSTTPVEEANRMEQEYGAKPRCPMYETLCIDCGKEGEKIEKQHNKNTGSNTSGRAQNSCANWKQSRARR